MRSSVFWFIFTPVAAKLLLALKYDVLPHTPYAAWSNVLVLPFPWWLLYLASLFFAVGRLAFRFKCHPVIRDYAHYRDFRSAGVASFQLTEWYTDLIDSRKYGRRDDELISNGQVVALNMFCERCFGDRLEHLVDQKTLEEGDYGMIGHEIWERNIPDRRVGDAFHMVKEAADRIAEGWALFAATFFALGMSTSAFLVVRNALYVLKAL